MKYSLVVLPAARQDIGSTFLDYEEIRVGLGKRFLSEMTVRIEAICQNPEMYGVLDGETRVACLRKFPHIIYFRKSEDQVFILAVKHGRQDASGWVRVN